MITIRKLTVNDFPLLLTWLTKPHVKEWWNDGDDTLEKVARHYGRQSATNERFILLYHLDAQDKDGQPVGYLQYEIDAAGVASIDQFIGEETLLNRGIGTQAIKLLLAHIQAHHPLRVVTVDPSPANKRAIRCYEKVGFQHDATLHSPPGVDAYMMKIELNDLPL
jgi:RimJ/RimL family protein N-acetyltransferase